MPLQPFAQAAIETFFHSFILYSFFLATDPRSSIKLRNERSAQPLTYHCSHFPQPFRGSQPQNPPSTQSSTPCSFKWTAMFRQLFRQCFDSSSLQARAVSSFLPFPLSFIVHCSHLFLPGRQCSHPYQTSVLHPPALATDHRSSTACPLPKFHIQHNSCSHSILFLFFPGRQRSLLPPVCPLLCRPGTGPLPGHHVAPSQPQERQPGAGLGIHLLVPGGRSVRSPLPLGSLLWDDCSSGELGGPRGD
jgi:hypothetical protein